MNLKEDRKLLSDRISTSTIKDGGGNLMLWACIGLNKVKFMTNIEGNMDYKQHIMIWDGRKLNT